MNVIYITIYYKMDGGMRCYWHTPLSIFLFAVFISCWLFIHDRLNMKTKIVWGIVFVWKILPIQHKFIYKINIKNTHSYSNYSNFEVHFILLRFIYWKAISRKLLFAILLRSNQCHINQVKLVKTQDMKI